MVLFSDCYNLHKTYPVAIITTVYNNNDSTVFGDRYKVDKYKLLHT